MADVKNQLVALRQRIEAQDGTVLDNVEGEMELDDVNENGNPRKGPVLVLRSIEEGALLKLTHPRPVTVLGSLSGQVFGAYRVKAGNLLSGRLEGARHVEIVHNLGSKGTSNVDSWIIFEGTSDPGFFAQAQHSLDKLRTLEQHQQPQREATARTILLRSLKDVPYDVKVFAIENRQTKTVFALYPGRRGKEVEMDLRTLLRYLLSKTESQAGMSHAEHIERFAEVLKDTITESMRLANSGGIGANLRKTQGTEVYEAQIDAVYEYLEPKLLQLWLKVSESFAQRIVDRLAEAPMILQVSGQLAPFFQIEYPRWKFHVTGGEITPERIADCNIACQLGEEKDTMSLTYNYVGGEDWISQTQVLKLDETNKCRLILKNGSVFLNGDDRCIFGPHLQQDDETEAAESQEEAA